MKIKISKLSFANNIMLFIFCMYIALFIGVTLLFRPDVAVLIVLILSVAMIIIFYSIIKLKQNYEASAILAIPIMLSAFQNVYLGMIISNITGFQLQIYLVINFIFVLGMTLLLLVINYNTKYAFVKDILIFLACLIAYAFILMIFTHTMFLTFFASFRNIFSPFIFFLFGAVLSRRVNKNEFMKIMLLISFCVIVFGIYEYIIGNSIWIGLNIGELWNKKGIGTNIYGIPYNFYSSEIIGGNQVRRMTATFADPVNLGTFLFAIFLIAWYQKKYFMLVITMLACVLTISKGALLGFLIFICLYGLYRFKDKLFFSIITIVVTVIGILFIQFSSASSTGSVFSHMNGLIHSIPVLIKNPFGLGVGNVGVLAARYGITKNNLIMESGLGMIIGQLGVLGLLIYLFFIRKILVVVRGISLPSREKIFYFSLIISIFMNIAFNEVALSPNSSGIYFIMIGLMYSLFWKQQHINMEKQNEDNSILSTTIS